MAGKKSKGKKKPGGGGSGSNRSSSRPPPPQEPAIALSPAASTATLDRTENRKNGPSWSTDNSASAAGGLAESSAAAQLSRELWWGGYAGREAVAGGGGGSGADGRGSSNGFGTFSRELDGRRRLMAGERERGDLGDRDSNKDSSNREGRPKAPPDGCHNGEGLGTSPQVQMFAQKEWSWQNYSTKQFRSFVQEFPPVLDIGADEVRSSIDNVNCGICRQSLRDALDAGMTRGGFPITKLVKLAACYSHERIKQHTRGGAKASGGKQGAVADAPDSSAGGKNEAHKTQADEQPPGTPDRLRIRAPVTPDLLRQVMSVVQAAAAAPAGNTPAAELGAGGPGTSSSAKNGEVALRELTVDEWLRTYPAPTAALMSGQTANGMRGTGSGTLAVHQQHQHQHGRSQGPEDTRDLWTLLERAERARDNAFKCCGVIEASTGVGLHDPSTGTGGGAGSSSGLASMTSNIEWNPQFAPRLQEAEAALVEWLTEVTMALHGLSFPFSLAFITEAPADGAGGQDVKSDEEEASALAEDLWTSYEESVKRQLELTLEARREQLREQSQPMGIALCFAAQNRACAAELLERKRAEMTALHDATVGVLRAAEKQPLLARSMAAREKWSELLIAEGCRVIDAIVERSLRARLQVFKCETFAYNASNDVIQAEQAADTQLKVVVQEWEATMETFKVAVEQRVADELSPTVYPQSPALTQALSIWLDEFRNHWVGNETTQQLHAHIRQRQVHGLCQSLVMKKQRLKTSKEEAAELNKRQRKKKGAGASNGVFSSSDQSEELHNFQSKQRELEERCSALATQISLTQQEQIETCLTYRLFAVGQLHQRYRKLRLFYAQLGCRVMSRASQATHLCGGQADADERIKIMGACLMLGIAEQACLRWTAVQNERQLVEGMKREDASLDAKRRKRERAKAKVRETKRDAATVANALAEAAAAQFTAAAEEAEPAKSATASDPAMSDSEQSTSREGSSTGAGATRAGGRGATMNGKPARDPQDAPKNSQLIGGGTNGRSSRQTRQPTPAGRSTTSRRSGSPVHGGTAGLGLGSAQAGKWGSRSARDMEESSGGGWLMAERAVSAADEDGFVTIAKSKPRRSGRDARESGSAQNGRGSWGGRGGGGGWHAESGGRPNDYGTDRRDRTRDAKPYDERRGKFSVGVGGGGVGEAGNPGAPAVPAATSSSNGTWMQRKKTMAEQQPEVCLMSGSTAGAVTPGGTGWPVPSAHRKAPSAEHVTKAPASASHADHSGGGWSVGQGTIPPKATPTVTASTPVVTVSTPAMLPTSSLQGSQPSATTPVASTAAALPVVAAAATSVAREPGENPVKDKGEVIGGGSSARSVPAAPAAVAGVTCGAGGLPVAPEEEIPEAAPVPSEAVGETAAGGHVKSVGELSGGEKVLGAGEAIETGAGGAAATASAVLGPESEVAGVTTGLVNDAAEERPVGLASGDSKEVVAGVTAAVVGKEIEAEGEEEQEEEYVFQFGTVNLSDEEYGEGADADGQGVFAEELGQNRVGSPENSRYGSGEEEAEEKQMIMMEDTSDGHVDRATEVLVSSPIAEDGSQTIVPAGERTDDEPIAIAEDGGGDVRSQPLPRPPLQTDQLRDGVFFPAHPPPAPQNALQNGGAYMSTSYQQQHVAPMQQPQQLQMQQQHHQHQVPHQHSQLSAVNQQLPPQRVGFSQQGTGGGIHGGLQSQHSQHQHHLHHHPSHNPYNSNNQRGVGMSGHHGSHGSNNPMAGSMHGPGTGVQGHHNHHHRRISSHTKNPGGPRHAPGDSGPHSPNTGGGFGGMGQYGAPAHAHMVQQSAEGFWGGGMMHYQVPSQPIMGPAPGGIGITDGQAVYYPPPPHMMVQGDGSGHGGAPWHPAAGHMEMGMGLGINIVMDTNGMPGMPPWVPDGTQHYPHPSSQGWGSPTHHGMTGYVPPPPQRQQQQQAPPPPPPPPLHTQAVAMSVQQSQQQQQQGTSERQHSATVVSSTLPAVPEDAEVLAPQTHGSYNNGSREVDTVDHSDTPPAQMALSPPPTDTEQVRASDSNDAVLAASPAVTEHAESAAVIVGYSGGNDGMGVLERAGIEAGAETNVAAMADTDTGAVTLVDSGVDGVVDANIVEAGGAPKEATRQDSEAGSGGTSNSSVARPEVGGEAAAAASAAGQPTPASTRQRKGKKDRGKRGHGTQGQGGGALRAAMTTSNGVMDSPGGEGAGKGRGSRGGSRGSAAGEDAQRVRGSDVSSSSVSPAVSAKKDLASPSAPMPRGLVNATGQNNCFLNVVVQSLWHLEAFRTRFCNGGSASVGGGAAPAGVQGAWGRKPQPWGTSSFSSSAGGAGSLTTPPARSPAEEASHRVEASLRGLFRELSAGVECSTESSASDGAGGDARGDDDAPGWERSEQGSGGNGASSASVEALRAALAEISGARFGVGKMDDAAEAMETILGCLVQGSSAAVIRQVFSMRIREALVCRKCGMSSPEKPVEYDANVLFAHVSALREAREKDPHRPFDGALKEASHGDLVACRNPACPLSRRKERLPSQRSITGEPPCVFSLGLVWNHWGPGLVADLLGMLSPVVDLDVVFSRGPQHSSSSGVGGGAVADGSVGKAHLRGFFCFQVQKHHYVAFVYNRGRQEWLLLDDDQAVPIGPDFAGVLTRCEEDKLHPSLFFYERQEQQQHPLA